jgi:hypothetical protein
MSNPVQAAAVAAKRVIAFERLLDPANSSVTLLTLQNAARAVGGKLDIWLAPGKPVSSRNTVAKDI